ncbi:beta-propeller domain-containing protein, partial [Candidatus Micrarchaeota archaeon]|nr:beta-propeller domain-containing protein [Candidatus Micrarchaeota archaeon]
GYYGGGMRAMAASAGGPMPIAASAESADSNFKSADYSTTNVQVEGVDEADIIKNDGEYLYVVAKNKKIVILKAFPPSDLKIVSEIIPSSGQTTAYVTDVFVNGDKLVVFGTENYDFPIPYKLHSVLDVASNASIEVSDLTASAVPAAVEGSSDISVANAKISEAAVVRPGVACYRCYPPYQLYSLAFMKVYDISDRANPLLLKTLSTAGGSYVDSRMIGSKVYAVFEQPAYYNAPVPVLVVDGIAREAKPSEIKFFNEPLQAPLQFTSIISMDLTDLTKDEERETVLMGGSQNIFASAENIYVTYTRYPYYNPVLGVTEDLIAPYANAELKQKLAAIDKADVDEWVKDGLKNNLLTEFIYTLSAEKQNEIWQKISKEYEKNVAEEGVEKTAIHKFSLGDGVHYEGNAVVRGSVLNQFSMDESNGYFRIATTTSAVWGRQNGGIIPFLAETPQPVKPLLNHVFVLDSNLSIVGKLEEIAPGESIYSARFIGDRAYLVTFKKIDPLFVISLEDPKNPKILGKLKIPGYSDYLHPYDATHLIGIGKNAVDAKDSGGDFAWYQGVKLSLFDVSDVEHPKEVAKYEIGDRGTDSNALHDHKAFLFSKSKNLLVIPILLAEIDESTYPEGVPDYAYGDFVFQGAYVFTVTPEAGFTLRGTVSHATYQDLLKSGYYWFSDSSVKRTAFIENTLYTISDNFVEANDLTSLELINYVQINAEEPPFPPVLQSAPTTTAQPPTAPTG